MTAAGVLTAFSERELRAGTRILHALTGADAHPVIRRSILAALGDLTMGDVSGFLMHADGALAAHVVSPEEAEAEA